jgi:hypothetical protein
MGRDPRVEPRAGDVVRRAKDGTTFNVIERDGAEVVYGMAFRDWRDNCASNFRESVDDWRKEHRRAVVIHVAEG